MKPCRGVTLIELLIVIGIVVILTAILIPSFSGLSDKQKLKQSAESFASDVRLVRQKALSGTVGNSKNNVWWGVDPCVGSGDSRFTKYRLGYAPDDNGSPKSSGRVWQPAKTHMSGIKFTSCPAVFFFERLTGRLSKNSVSILMTNGSDNITITIYKSGKVVVSG